MALEGVLEEFGLTDILQLLYFQKKTGTLNVTSSTDVVKLSLIEGNITKIESKKQLGESRLGRMPSRRRCFPGECLAPTAESARKPGTR